jgi:UDPglucose--hexose-1-phosphate uridylyltransferase
MNSGKRASEKRWNPLLGEWTIIAPVTAVRPWSGTIVAPSKNDQPEFDPDCYLCPGVKRTGGEINPRYHDVYIFNNDFSSLSMEYSNIDYSVPFFTHVPAQGICRVVCFSPKHNITLPEMTIQEITTILHTLKKEFTELSSIPEIQNVMIFENRGKIIGVSNPHPHGQIYSTDFVPRIPWTMYSNSRSFWKEKGKCL